MARAKEEKTTVHGALAAAMILGTMADKGRARGSVSFGSPVNVRGVVEPAVAEDVGFFVSLLAYRDAVDTAVPFWELARRVRRQLEASRATGDELAMLVLFRRAFDLVGVERLSPQALADRLEKLVVATTGLTNLGRLTIATEHGPLKLEECHFAACPSALGQFLATATSLHGRIFWNFIWPDPVFTEAHANALVADIVARLQQAIR